jgi:hypothetical protein
MDSARVEPAHDDTARNVRSLHFAAQKKQNRPPAGEGDFVS